MKNKTICLLVCMIAPIILFGCASASNAAAQTPSSFYYQQLTAQPATRTAAPVTEPPTLTVTPTPESSPTPTEAIDPVTGWKMQIVDGEKQLFSPDVNAWVVPDGSAYLINSQEESGVVPNAFQMQVFYLAEKGFVEPTINQAPELTSGGYNFTGMFLVKVEMRELGHMIRSGAKGDVPLLQSGKIISFTTPAGPQSFTITTDSKYRVYIMPYDQMPDGYFQMIDTNLNKHFRWLVSANDTDVVIKTSYEGNLADLSKQKFIKMLLYGLATVMDPNQDKGLYTNPPSVYPSGFGDYIDTSLSLPSFQVNGLTNP